MRQKNIIAILVICIAFFASVAASFGIFSDSGTGSYDYMSIRGKSIPIYGRGLYHDMSADVAIQGIAQDYITLFLGIPLLLAALSRALKGSVRARFILAGILNYFLVTYLFYLEIAMYNWMFLVYVILTGASFFSLALVLLSFDIENLKNLFSPGTPVRFTGGFLIFNAVAIAMLWLSVVVPPLIDGTIIPDSVEHYTTLTVQGLDLALFLPLCFISGLLLIRRTNFGYLMATVTLGFLSLLMTALVAKLVAMASSGVSVIPAIFIIPVILLLAITSLVIMIRSIKVS